MHNHDAYVQENLERTLEELRSGQKDFLIANEQIENLGTMQQYRDEQHRTNLDILENKINVACVEDDTGKVQLSVDLRVSNQALGEFQGELTSKVRQLDLVQSEIKRITDSRDTIDDERGKLERQVAQYQNEIQRANNVNAIAENDKMAMVLDQANRQRGFEALKDNEQKLKDLVSRLEMSVRELSQKADAPDPDVASVIARCSLEVIKAKAETTSQQDVLSRRIDEMVKKTASRS